MIDFFNNNSGLFNLIFSATVAIATVIYAILTWKLVSETRKIRQIQTEPDISVRIKPQDDAIQYYDFIIENIGLAPAFNIAFNVVQGDHLMKDPKLSEGGPIKNGIKYFAPKEKIIFWGGSFPEYLKSENKTPVAIDIIYENSLNEKRTAKSIINLEEFLNLSRLGAPPIVTISKNIKMISDDLHSALTGWRKIKLDVYDNEDREKENKKLEERMNQDNDK